MHVKLKPPCWVKHIDSGALLRCRSISRANARMKRQGWQGLVAHVQNENGTGIVEYRRLVAPTQQELDAFNERVRKKFGV